MHMPRGGAGVTRRGASLNSPPIPEGPSNYTPILRNRYTEKGCARASARGDGGEGSNRDKERAEHRHRSRSSPTNRGTAGHKKGVGDSAGGTGGLGVTASCRTCARNRARLRGAGLAYRRRHDLATLRRHPGDARCLSCARRGLAACAATREAQTMTTLPVPKHRPRCRADPGKDQTGSAFGGPADCRRLVRGIGWPRTCFRRLQSAG